jgi:hypothetical protein
MALAVETDPQFMAPERPSLLPGLVFVPLPDGLLVEGAAERQVLRGRAASTLLPAILPLLDGSRTRTQVAQTLPGTAPEAVQATLAMLYTCGLLEDAAGPAHPAGSEPTGAAAQSAAFLTRQIDTTRVNRNGAEIMDRLGTARVLILGDPDCGDRVVAELHSCGVTRAAACPTLNLTGTRPDLVVLVSAGAPTWMLRPGSTTRAPLQVCPGSPARHSTRSAPSARTWTGLTPPATDVPLRRAPR